jgi:hypothetical protein
LDAFAVILVIGWNLFVIWVCVKLLRIRNNWIDSIGGDSRKPERNLIASAIAEYRQLKRSIKLDALRAERVRKERERNGN